MLCRFILSAFFVSLVLASENQEARGRRRHLANYGESHDRRNHLAHRPRSGKRMMKRSRGYGQGGSDGAGSNFSSTSLGNWTNANVMEGNYTANGTISLAAGSYTINGTVILAKGNYSINGSVGTTEGNYTRINGTVSLTSGNYTIDGTVNLSDGNYTIDGTVVSSSSVVAASVKTIGSGTSQSQHVESDTFVATTTEKARVTTTVAVTTATTNWVTATTSSSSSASHTGQATYFYQEGGQGACGNYFADSALIVAIQVDLYGDTGVTSQYCGKSITITNTDNGKSTTATIQDACPGCDGKYSLDLSVGAFEAIGDLDTGVLPISWVFN